MPTPPIPGHWSPAQALAVYEPLDALLQAIWAHYHRQIQEQICQRTKLLTHRVVVV